MGRKTARAEAYDRAMSWRVPADAPPPVKAIADEALEALVAVMRQPDRHARERVAACTRIRDEVCGMLSTRTEISGSGGAPMAVSISIGGAPAVVEPEPEPARLPPAPVPPRVRKRNARQIAGNAPPRNAGVGAATLPQPDASVSLRPANASTGASASTPTGSAR